MVIKILLASDWTSDHVMIKNALREYHVLFAREGAEVVRMIREDEGIDLLILDLDISNMSGVEVLEALKADHRLEDLRTIILNDDDAPDNEILGVKFGAVDYIPKPVHVQTLIARIELHVKLLSARQSLEHRLQEYEITFEEIFNQAPIGIAVSHSEETNSGNFLQHTKINPAYEKITGRTKEELLKVGWTEITHPDDVAEDLKNYEKLRVGEIDGYTMEKRFIKPDGSVTFVQMICTPLILSEKHQFNHIAMFKDISESKEMQEKLAESERSKSMLLSNLPGLAYRCHYDSEWTMQYVSEGCFELTGYFPENLIGNRDVSYNNLIVPEYRDAVRKEWERMLPNRLPFYYEYEILTASGERKWVIERGQGVYDDEGKVEALEGIILDISERKAIEDALKYNNEHDRWTGLLNRSYLENLLNEDAKKGLLGGKALVGVNLSSVQALTTTYGFHYTQGIVRDIAQALLLHCTDNCLLFNTYENRFVFYLTEYKDQTELMVFCNTIKDTLESILAIERIGGGIGVIEFDQNYVESTDRLLRNLLITSEKAANCLGSGVGICFYDAEIEMQIMREQTIKRKLNELAEGDHNKGLYLKYQPILDLKTNQVSGFEALAAIHCDRAGSISPREFIPIAEETKLIIPIGKRINRLAFGFIQKLNQLGYDAINVSVNVSVIQLLEKGFCDSFLGLIDEMKIAPQHVGIEITETVFSSDYEGINDILARLKEAGIRVSIDDFGTGYSSLAREKELNVNCLKIDKSFIDGLISATPEKSLTGDIISIAHKFDHRIVAEGVEHESQRQYLIDHGCDMIQGYLISKPLEEDAAIEILKKYNDIK